MGGTMELNKEIGQTKLSLGVNISINAGDKFKIEVGEDELDEVVPEGKVWLVAFMIDILEEDAKS